MKEQPQFNFKSLTPMISGKHLKGLSKSKGLHIRNQSANLGNTHTQTSSQKVLLRKTPDLSISRMSAGSGQTSLKQLKRTSIGDTLSAKKPSFTAVKKPKKLLPRPPGSNMRLAFGQGGSIVIKSVLN